MEEYLKKFMEIADGMGLEIVDVEFVNKELMALRVAYKDFQAVTLETCVELSRAFGEAIDFEISLDVSSAGAEREIDPEDYQSLKDQYVLIKFKNPFKGADYVEGFVIDVDEERFIISYQDMHRYKEVAIEIENVAMCRLAVKV